ncbi:MAG: FapA family protein [Bacillus sp. (in: Bacteria)]|nr:FapA family protein [Bacillus sp. (in: firmicutes)]MCM1427076.1 FapA family protein [Eubacterium sp.]
MGFFKQAGKKKKKEQADYADILNIEEAGRLSFEDDEPENEEMEKIMFLSPEERYPSKEDDGYFDPEDGEDSLGDSGGRTVQGEPIIINGSDYLLRINETRMEAMLTLYRSFTQDEICALLEENGVVYGIREDTVAELAKGNQNYEETLVARGTAAKDGRDGFFEYHFNPHPATGPIVLADGSVDYNVLGKMELVKEGQLLVTYHAARPVVFGTDVLGNSIDAYEGKELAPLQCKRCELDESSGQYYAVMEGNVTIEGKALVVTPLYVIDGNLDAATGNVDFHGDVLVQGNVFAGVTVKTTGSITINGHVETASLFAGKDVILTNGMQGSGNGVIRAGHNVMARFLEQTQVFAGNEINTGALLNCEVESGQSVIVAGRGTIIGGRVTAVEQIAAASIGNHAGVNTQLVIGLDCEFKTKMAEIDRLMEEYQNSMTDAARALDRIAYQLRSQPATPELSQQKAEQMRQKIHYQLKLKETATKREQMIDINKRSAGGKIVVSGIANVGCVIIINGVREILHSEYRDITFKKSRQEIRIVSNKQ